MINLTAAAIAFFIGLATRYMIDLLKVRRARRFWKSMTDGENRFVLGGFEQFEQFEPSGLMGVGDARALHEILALFDQLKMRRLGIVHASRLADGDLDANLVLLGGGDGNAVTESIMSQVRTGFSFLTDGVTIRDDASGKTYTPDVSGRRVIFDYGIIARVASPFSPLRKVVIVAGGYGYGSWAGAHMLNDSEFLKEAAKSRHFSCLFRTALIGGIPQRATLIEWHAIT
jgi:hypothetical protein